MDLLPVSLAIIFICLFGLSWFAGTDAPYVPTKLKLIRKILKIAGVRKHKIFYELGSGDGRVVLEAAKLGTQSNGVEESWIRVWYSRYRAWKLTSHIKCGNINFYHGNIFDRHYYPTDFVYIYMLPKAVYRLEKKLKEELKKGSIIITQTYHFKNWKPYKKEGNFWLYKIT